MTFARGLTRVPTGDKMIENRLLNVLGVQVVRTVAARVMYNIRPVSVDPLIRDRIAELRREGVTVWPDFLPREAFDAVRCEFLAILDLARTGVRDEQHGRNRLELMDVLELGERLPATCSVLAASPLLMLLEAAEKRPLKSLRANATLERLVQGAGNGDPDPQVRLHSDAFYNTHKAWLYLTDVTPDAAPLVYVRRSHRVTAALLGHAYRASYRFTRGDDHSRRISAEEVSDGGLHETVFTCGANTLVVANTCGYHRRLDGRPGATRDALHVSLRANPFTAAFRRDAPRVQ